jgi:hypothetical protein
VGTYGNVSSSVGQDAVPSGGKGFSRVKFGVGEGSIREDNLALARMVRRDRLMGNFHLMKVILTSEKVSFELWKLLFL